MWPLWFQLWETSTGSSLSHTDTVQYCSDVARCAVSLRLLETSCSLKLSEEKPCEGWRAAWHLCHLLWHQASFRHICSWRRTDVACLKTDESGSLVHLQKSRRRRRFLTTCKDGCCARHITYHLCLHLCVSVCIHHLSVSSSVRLGLNVLFIPEKYHNT